MPLDEEIQQALHTRAQRMPVREQALRERIRTAAAAPPRRRWLTEPLQFALAALLLVGLAAGGFLLNARTRQPAAPPPAPTAASRRYMAIVDARGDQAGGQVHILDLQTQSIVRSIAATSPDGIFLPDGETLVIGTPAGLTWYKAPMWQPTRTAKASFHAWWHFYPEESAYALSSDGKHLYAVVYDPTTPPGGAGRLALEDLDLTANQSAGRNAPAPIPTCAGRLLTPPSDAVYLLCLNSRWTTLRMVHNQLEAVKGEQLWEWDPPNGRSLAAELLSADGHVIAVSKDGEVARFDPRPGAQPGQTTFRDPILEAGRVIPFRQTALSPDGQTLYVGTAPAPCIKDCGEVDLKASLSADRIEAYSTKTWTRTATLPVTHPFTDIAVSPDGKTLITVSPADRTVSFSDAGTGKELKTLTDVGAEPSRFIAGPQPLVP